MKPEKKKSYLVFTRFAIFFIFNYLFFWFILSLIGVEKIKPIGHKDIFGYFFPPYWFDLFIAFMTLLCYLICSGVYMLWQNKKDAKEMSKDKRLGHKGH